jgi:hypothetical protein
MREIVSGNLFPAARFESCPPAANTLPVIAIADRKIKRKILVNKQRLLFIIVSPSNNI